MPLATEKYEVVDDAGPYVVTPYKPRGACEEIFYCTDHSILLEGPAGTGKSRSVLEKVKLLCKTFKNIRILLVRKTRNSMSETVLATWENHVLPPRLIKGDARRNNRQHYDMPNNNTIVLGGMDNPDRIMSSDYDVICAFEATELVEEDYENLTTRLRNHQMPYQQIICDCNPGIPGHFLNNKAKNGEMTRLMSRHTDNPMLYKDDGTPTKEGAEYMYRLGKLSGARKQRLLLGNWAAADNLVYEVWDPQIHIIDQYDEPFSHFLVGVDWGYRDAGVFQVWGIDFEGRAICVYQIYRTLQDMDWWKKKAGLVHKKYHPKRWICDHAPDKVQQFTRMGLPAMKAKKDISLGISIVQARLQPQEDGKPMIYFLRDSLGAEDIELKQVGHPVRAEEEFWSYTYNKRKEERNQKEEPVDYMNHGMDTMRYVMVYLDKYRSIDIDYKYKV